MPNTFKPRLGEKGPRIIRPEVSHIRAGQMFLLKVGMRRELGRNGGDGVTATPKGILLEDSIETLGMRWYLPPIWVYVSISFKRDRHGYSWKW